MKKRDNMKILVIDTCHNSLKFTLYQMNNENIICHGLFERIGLENGLYTIYRGNEIITEEMPFENYTEAATILIQKLLDLELVASQEDISLVGYRIPQGKNVFSKNTFLTEEALSKLDQIDIDTSNVKAIKETVTGLRESIPNIEIIGVFETAFFQDLPEESYLYALPYKWYQDYGVRKYGTQGITHEYIMREMQSLFQKEDIKLISCCLDRIGSIAAIKNGKCQDVSTGFSSLSGIVMGTKSGDIDSSIIPYVMEKEGKNVSEILEDLNQRSGLLGLSEISENLEDILSACMDGNEKARIAKEQYIRHIVNYISQYYVLLDKPDAIVFTASIGEKSPEIRAEILEKLDCLGIKIDYEKNKHLEGIGKITREDSILPVYVVPMDLELEVAKAALKLINR